MKKYPHGLTLNAVCAAIDDYQRHEDSVPEEGILAAFNTLLGHSDIAEELRSTERTADTNMAAAQAMRDDMYYWKQRAEAAEVKLAEQNNQKPVGKFCFEYCGNRWHHIKHGEAQYREPKLPMVPLFARPAPAINLTPISNCLSFFASVIKSGESWSETCQRDLDAAREILRNIEEAK